VLSAKYYYNDKLKGCTGGACSTHGSEENAYKIMDGNLKERDTLKEMGLHRRIILKWMLKK
jgi:hypothetical protein